MPDPRWMSPPEVVAAIFEAGPGPASVLANQLVWIIETVNHELVTGLSALNTATTASEWIGLGGVGSAQSAVGLNTGLQTLIGWITHKVAVAQAAADAYLLATSTVIPALVSQSNRDETAALHATNFMGVNTPAIIERDTEYFGEYWPHNSSIGWTYSGALTGLIGTLGVPPPLAPLGASPTAPAATGAAAAQQAADAAAQGGLRASTAAADAPARAASAADPGAFLQQGSQLASTMTDPVKSFAQAPTQALQGFTSAPQALMGAFSAMRPAGTFGADPALMSAVSEPVRLGTGVTTGVGAGGVGGYPAAALTSYTRPASTFAPEAGGRPVGRAGVLNAAELRGPVSGGGTPVPLAPAAGMLGRARADGARDEVAQVRIVVDQTGGAGATRR